MKRFLIILILLALLSALILFYNQKQNGQSIPADPNSQTCSSDDQCPSGHFCDISSLCPRGYPPEQCKVTGTKTCIKTCSTDSECTPDLSCQNITIMKGDAGDRKKGCLDKQTDPQTLCEGNSGRWLEAYNECENILAEVCTSSGGIFNGCDSACRHDPNYPNVACIKVCVAVCKFF